ncbi:hypothetical protein ACFE04_023480 [Oxalis oulophora]
MDYDSDEPEPQPTEVDTGGSDRRSESCSIMFRFVLVLLFPIVAFFLLSFVIGIVAVFVGELSITNPVSLPSQCKIVTSSVDIRSSKVCELGLLNYKAKNVFYPFETNKFRCRYDYYWASVFQVEYKDHTLGQTSIGSAEVPDEALPHTCRPNFGGAWLIKDKFKVNQTYDCWYTYGISKVSLYREGFFSCLAKEPSKIEMSRRYFILLDKMTQSVSKMESDGCKLLLMITGGLLLVARFVKILRSWFLNNRHVKSVSWGALAGVIAVRFVIGSIKTIWFRRACLLVAYISFTCWLAIQYAKLIGLPTSLAEYKS